MYFPSALAFIIYGVPRSGTTALARAVNLQPNIFCSHERQFAYRAAALQDELLREIAVVGENPSPARLRDSATLTAKVQQQGASLILGDKQPDYFLNLAQIEVMHPHLRQVCIYRSPFGFMPSWDKRADNPEDRTWRSGRRGIFGLMEMLLMFRALANSRGEALVVSHAAAFFDHDYIIKAVVTHLTGAEPDPAVRGAFRAGFFQKRPADAEGGPYSDLLRAIGVPDLDAQIRRRRMFRASEKANMLRQFVEQAAPILAERLPRTLDDLPPERRREVATYGRGWVTSRLGNAPMPGDPLHEALMRFSAAVSATP